MGDSKKGFSSILVILAILGIVGVLIFIFKSSKPQEIINEKEISTQVEADGKYVNWKNYTSSKFGVSFKYPPTFSVEEQSNYGDPLEWSLWTTYNYPDRPVRTLSVKYYNPEIDVDLLSLNVGQKIVKTYDVSFKETTTRLSNQIIGGRTVQVYQKDHGYETPGPIEKYLFVDDKNEKGMVLEIEIMNSNEDQSSAQTDAQKVDYVTTFRDILSTFSLNK